MHASTSTSVWNVAVITAGQTVITYRLCLEAVTEMATRMISVRDLNGKYTETTPKAAPTHLTDIPQMDMPHGANGTVVIAEDGDM